MKLPGQKPALTPEQVRELIVIRDQYRALPTKAEICARFGICETTLNNYWREPHRKHHGREA